MKTSLIVSFCVVFLLAACGEHEHGDDHPHAADGSHAEAAAQVHDHAPGAEKITHFSEHTELFVEFPALVVGETSAFAAHVTRLSDFKALAAGKVSVILSGDGGEEIFSSDKPSQPGIFRPEAKPKQAGERELSIEVATADFTVRHLLGPVTVHPDRKSAAAANANAAHDESGIGFTKEQQWKVDFATAEVVQRPIRASVAATGVIRGRPDGEARITAPAAGVVKPAQGFPRLGQQVKQGELLAHFVARLGGDSDMASLQADARKAQVAFDLAVRERERIEKLFRDEAVPEKRLLDARAAEASARAEHDAARGRLGQYGAGANTGGIPLRAPVAGGLADVRVAPGAYVQEGETLFHIVDRRALWLELRVAESEAPQLTSPSGASFHIAGIEPGFEIVAGKNGRLIAVGGAVDQTTRTVPVLFEFTQPDPRLRIGMGVNGRVFGTAAREATAIPAGAVLDEGGVATVFVMTGGESFERRQVRLGARDGDWVEVIEGLTPGQRVVSRGAWLVKLAATGTGDIGHGHAH